MDRPRTESIQESLCELLLYWLTFRFKLEKTPEETLNSFPESIL